MASGYDRSLGETLIWVSTAHMTHASIIVIPLARVAIRELEWTRERS